MSVTADPFRGDPDDPSAPPAAGVVELTVPVESDLLVLARLTISTVAARSSFDIEEIEDLRLAVDELCLSVLQGRRVGRLHLRFEGTPDQIEVWCRYDGTAEPADQPEGDADTDGLSGRILDALVDEHGPVTGDGWLGSRLCKRRVVHPD
jgi:hypothetical protein